MTVTDIAPRPPTEEVYLGDAVYASFDGWQIRLRTADGNNQVIYLEPMVFANLLEYERRLRTVAEKE